MTQQPWCPVIIKDEHLLAAFRANGTCEWCLCYCPGQIDANHIFARGMGGGQRLDIRINLVALCRWGCHPGYHAGKITRRQLLELVAHREQTTVEDIVAEVYRLKRLPKAMEERRIKSKRRV